ncbi:MAG TPA: 16S rRNA (guanine(527)-N(7))-methyltransferase RsmG [Streptosporangiaceae bacterium]|nr:16S rRNA (guanine(527)-N(7))-methyltransferase RsmG [Streptosporangiaceae bacterium]
MPTPPAVARLVFGDALATAEAYAEFLAGPGVERGVLGPAETERIWDRHLLNCAVVAELVPPVRELVDIGSGAGLPGVVLAMLLPRVHVVLVESMARRTAFLTECVNILGLTNVDVRRGRAEDMAGQLAADVVTARAVARLDRLVVLAAGVARRGGLVLALKGAAAADELAEAAPVLRRLGASGVEIVTAGTGVVSQPTTVVRFRTSSDSHRYAGPTSARKRGPGAGDRERAR